MHEQRRRRQDRRWGRVGAELAVGGDDRGPAVAPAEPAIGAELEVLARLFLEVLSRRRRAGREPCRDRLVHGLERVVVRSVLGEVEADVGQDLNRRVQQNGTLDPLGVLRAELEDQPRTEAVPDPQRALHAGRTDRLEHVGDMGRDAPGWLVARATVTAEVGREHAEVGPEALLGQAAEAAPVRGDAVPADERRSLGLAPFVQMEEHQLVPVKEPANAGSVSRQSPATATSAVPVTGSAELLKTTITAAFTDAAACSKSPSVSTAT